MKVVSIKQNGQTQFNYNPRGYLCEITDYSTGGLGCSDTYSQFYWQANSADAFDHITQETAGNDIVTSRTYSQATGNLLGVAAGPSYSVFNASYVWDSVGNLITRADNLENYSDNFCYDPLYRLTSYSVGGVANTHCDSGSCGVPRQKSCGTYRMRCAP